MNTFMIFAKMDFSFARRSHFKVLIAAFICTLGETNAVKHVIKTGGNAELACVSASDPMWLMQGHKQSRLHGIAVGDKKNVRFNNLRFDQPFSKLCDSIALFLILSFCASNFQSFLSNFSTNEN